LVLYSQEDQSLRWRGKVEAGEFAPQPVWFVGGNTHLIEDVLQKALSHAMSQLRWKAGFQQALNILAGARID
jgi:hypothetical protein